MKTLLILRHAKSSWDDPDCDDHDRPLNPRGLRTAPLVGQLIRDENIVPELIVSSTAKRARETAHIVGENCGYQSAVELNPNLYPTSAPSCLNVLADIDDRYDSVLLVGHNPGLEHLAEHFSGHYERLPTAALVQFSLDVENWSDLSADTAATLVNLWRPKEVFPT